MSTNPTLKIKLVKSNDIRVFKGNKLTKLDETLNLLKKFVEESFKLNDFRLQFKDSENDLITIANGEDLEEALETSDDNNSIPKIYVTKV